MRRLCVFCASAPGHDPVYRQTAHRFGALLAARGLGLVYGGGNVGLMGALADGALAAGGEVIGVIPHGLVEREVAHRGLTELRVVGTMHQRKQLMHELADGFVALPGGLGTFDELFETLTWAQLGVHRKPCALLDVAGYFGPLLALLDHSVSEGLLHPDHRALLLHDDDGERLLDRLARHQPPSLRHWIDRRQA